MISDRGSDPKRCICGCRGFYLDKETKKYNVWRCYNCGLIQKIKKGKEMIILEF